MLQNIKGSAAMVLAVYLIAINIVAFGAYGVDKWKATHEQWRISENTLVGLAAAGGGVGAWAGMKVFHHKTQHMKFRVLVPLFTVLWIIAIAGGCYFLIFRR